MTHGMNNGVCVWDLIRPDDACGAAHEVGAFQALAASCSAPVGAESITSGAASRGGVRRGDACIFLIPISRHTVDGSVMVTESVGDASLRTRSGALGDGRPATVMDGLPTTGNRGPCAVDGLSGAFGVAGDTGTTRAHLGLGCDGAAWSLGRVASWRRPGEGRPPVNGVPGGVEQSAPGVVV